MASRLAPTPETRFLEDGSVEIRVGDLLGWVSSSHLLETKARQLQTAWLRIHSPETPSS